MCTDKSNEKSAYGKFYHNDQSVVVSSDVEDIVLVTNIVGIREVGSNL